MSANNNNNPGNATPPPLPSEMATIDPLFEENGSQFMVLWAMAKKELSKYTSELLSNITTQPIEKKKNVISLISAGISLIVIVLSEFFHFPMLGVFIVMVNLMVCLHFTKNVSSFMLSLAVEARNRPDEPIANIVANLSLEICSSKKWLRIGAYAFLVALLPLCLFWKSHIFYESAPDGKYVRYYIDGIVDACANVEIPETVDGIEVRGIRGDAFKGTGIESITLPNSIDTLRGHAFEGCASLKSINLPKSLKYIGGYAFAGCVQLGEVDFPSGLTFIAGHAFEGCRNLTFGKMGNSLDSIGGYAFADCQSIKSVIIPGSVSRIGGGCFKGCSSLREVRLPHGITEISGETFIDCSSLASIEIPEGVARIGGSAFRNCQSLAWASLPSTLREIGSSAFRKCPSLESVEIPAGCDVNERAFKESPTQIAVMP